MKRTKSEGGNEKKASKNYFTAETEAAIIEYVQATKARRQELYIQYINPAFTELIDKIVYTYKYNGLQDLDYLKDDCKIHLLSILSNFDPDCGSKAFSYFTRVTINWFSFKAKKEAKRKMTEVDVGDVYDEDQLWHVTTENEYEATRESSEFWEFLSENMLDWKTETQLTKEESLVFEAVDSLMKNVQDTEIIFNKKAIYVYLREITGLDTKQITPALNKLKGKYLDAIRSWKEDIL